MDKTKEELKTLISRYPYDAIEMDFVKTGDNILVWSHSLQENGNIIANSKYKDISNLLTLEDILEILDGHAGLLLELKWFAKNPKKYLEDLLSFRSIKKLSQSRNSEF